MAIKSPIRSKTYQRMFDDKFMLETFGTLTPDVSTRTSYFFQLWMDWRPNRFRLKQHASGSDIRHKLLEYGLIEFRDFQIRNGEVRFASDQYSAMAKLSGIERYTR